MNGSSLGAVQISSNLEPHRWASNIH